MLLFVGIAMSVSFAACGGDDDDEPADDSAIVGTWYVEWSDEYGVEWEEYTFRPNGAYSWVEGYRSYGSDNTSYEYGKGTYTYDAAKQLLIISSDYGKEFITCIIKGDTMTFYFDDDKDDDGPTVWRRTNK